MLYDDLTQTINSLDPDIQFIQTFWRQGNIEQDFQELKRLSEQELFWQNPDRDSILKQLQYLTNIRKQYNGIIKQYTETSEFVELLQDDQVELERLQEEIKTLKEHISKFKIALLLSGPDDDSACFLSINSGAGGTESQDWANMLLRMYLRFCETQHLNARIVDQQFADEAGIKSATLYVKGKNAYGLLKSEAGVHRLVRISPFDANKRRHTSFAALTVSPEMPEIEITIEPADLRIDTYRASGAGGQHVNKTESAVRITHMPSGVVVQCQNERSQLQNRETAMKMLRARIAQKLEQEQREKANSVKKKKIEWGSQIRSYVLHPYKMVKDHRTGHESSQPERVLDGELSPFIESFLLWYQTHK